MVGVDRHACADSMAMGEPMSEETKIGLFGWLMVAVIVGAIVALFFIL